MIINKSNNGRLFLFIDDECLKILSESDEWLMDGTFKSAPEKFLQLYTIHANANFNNNHTTIPCAYILTNSKDALTYREAFGFLKDLALY